MQEEDIMERLDRTSFAGWDRAAESEGNPERLANALGWFSIGLGIAEVAAPSRVAQLIGVPDEERSHGVLRAYGMREIAAGIGILSQPRPTGWMWGRVAGDLLDLATLGSALKFDTANSTRIATATTAILGVTALDAMVAQQLSNTSEAGADRRSSCIRAAKAILINRSPDEVYRFWRNFENLPRFMNYLESVEVIGDRLSLWKVNAAGMTLQWEAEITNDQPGRYISWRSLENAEVDNSGEVRFEDAAGRRGTYVKVDLEYNPPGGRIGAAVAKLFAHSPEQLIGADLRRFKQIMEVGEVVHSDASIHSGMHPAQPPKKIPQQVQQLQEWQSQQAWQRR
jgi:uncharacterized membrane protein